MESLRLRECEPKCDIRGADGGARNDGAVAGIRGPRWVFQGSEQTAVRTCSVRWQWPAIRDHAMSPQTISARQFLANGGDGGPGSALARWRHPRYCGGSDPHVANRAEYYGGQSGEVASPQPGNR